MRADRLKDATVTDVLENPGYYGMPTNLAEIRAFVGRHKQRRDQVFTTADSGDTILSGYVRRQKYFVEAPDGTRVDCGKSLERVERVATDLGLDWTKLEMFPEVIPDLGLKCDMHVTFKLKPLILKAA